MNLYKILVKSSVHYLSGSCYFHLIVSKGIILVKKLKLPANNKSLMLLMKFYGQCVLDGAHNAARNILQERMRTVGHTGT